MTLSTARAAGAAGVIVATWMATGCGGVRAGSGGSGGGATTSSSASGSSTTSAKSSTAAATTHAASTTAVASVSAAGPTTSSGASGFCDGTKVAGTCAQPFFEAVATCLSALGSCKYQITPTGNATFNEDECWSTGQKRHTQADGTNQTTVSTWTGANGVCLTSQSTKEAGTFTANGVSIAYDESTGVLSCPDGTTANIGTPTGGDLCPDVDAILSNNCAQGTCP